MFTDAKQIPQKPLSDDLTAITDTIAVMCESVIDRVAAPDHACSMLQLVMDWHYKLRSEGLAEQTKVEVAPELEHSATAEASIDSSPSPVKEFTDPLQREESGDREQAFFSRTSGYPR